VNMWCIVVTQRGVVAGHKYDMSWCNALASGITLTITLILTLTPNPN